jgi:hypothetical protein
MVTQEILRHRAELKSALAVLEPIYQRCTRRLANAQAARIVPAADVDPRALAAFAVPHVGGLPEDVARRLNGYGAAYSPAISMVALVGNKIVGAVLTAPQGHDLFYETLAVDAAHRGGGLNLALMYRSAAAAAARGIQTIEFEHDTQGTDIFKLAGRFGATRIGCRQCWGASLPASAQETQQESPSQAGEREKVTHAAFQALTSKPTEPTTSPPSEPVPPTKKVSPPPLRSIQIAMTFTQWLRKVFGSRKQVARGSHRGNSRPAWRYRFVARVEFLEDRLAPAVLLVTNNNDSGTGSLRDAILASVNRATDGLGQTGTGNDTIQFASSVAGQTIGLSSTPLNDVSIGSKMAGPSAFFISNNTTLEIDGLAGLSQGITIARTSSTPFRLFDVATGSSLTLQDLTLSNGLAKGFGGGGSPNAGGGGGSAGLGGAIFNQGTVTIVNSTLTGNTALGGAGGSSPGAGGAGGGGGAGLGAAGLPGLQSPPLYNGGDGGGPNAGAGGEPTVKNPAPGGFGGGGGGAWGVNYPYNGASGGFGGGGGGGGNTTGGHGGFGGGGGGRAASGGYGGGNGGSGPNGQGTGGGGGAGMGGAVFNEAGTVVLTNSTFYYNGAYGGAGGTGLDGDGRYSGTAGNGLGGGLFNHNGTVTITNSTFSGNTAAQGGGSVFNIGDGAGKTATLTLTNSILTNFQAAVINNAGLSMSGTDNLIVSPGQTGTGPSGGAQYSFGSVAVGNAGFGTPNVGTGFQYNPSGAAWTFTANSGTNGSGVAGNGSGFTNTNPSAPEGTQVGFIQGTGSISQSLTFTAGTFTINFQAAQRANVSGNSQNFQVTVDGIVVGTFTPSGTSYAGYTTSSFTVTAGAHTVGFVGLNTKGGDNTAFIDQVTVLGGPLSGVGPQLGSLASNGGPTQTMALGAGSPAIGAGTFTGAPPTDQRGVERISTVDIGAFQYSTVNMVVNTSADATSKDSFLSLREAINLANGSLLFSALSAAEQAQVIAAPGNAANTITFASTLNGSTLTLSTVGDGSVGPSAFLVNSPVAIDGPSGNSGITLSAAGTTMRLFDVPSGGSLTLQYLTLQGGTAQGFTGGTGYGGAGGGSAGLGGAIFNQGSLNLFNSTLTGNTAQGGAGGSPVGVNGGGGGGAGLDGTGGAGSAAPVSGTTGDGGGGGGPNGGVDGVASTGGGGGFGGGGSGGFAKNSATPSAQAGGAGGFGGGGGGGGVIFPAHAAAGGAGGFGGGGGGGGSGGGTQYGGGSGGAGVEATGGGGGAGMGGAVFNEAGTVVITNSTLTANTASGGAAGVGAFNGTAGKGLGGGLFNHNGLISVINSTFSANTAAQGGRDVFTLGDSTGNTTASTTATATITNTILGQADTTVQDFTGKTNGSGTNSTSGTNNLIRTQSGFAGSIVSTADPMLAALGNYGGPTPTMALLPGSPAIDAGTDAAVTNPPFSGPPFTDQRGPGFPRVLGAHVDIGAYELTPNADFWTGGGGNNNWSNNSNWVDSTGTVHQAPTETSDVIFASGPMGSNTTSVVSAAFTINTLIISSASAVLTANNSLTVANTTINSGKLQALSGGTVNLNGNATNQGRVFVDATSTLTLGSTAAYTQSGTNPSSYTAINGIVTASGSASITINNGLLDGTGTITAPVTIGAGSALLPGYFNAGTLTINGNVTFNAAAQFFVIVNGSTAGTFSQLVVSGSVTLNGATVGVSQNSTYVPNNSIKLTIISAPSSTGSFSTTIARNVSSGFAFIGFSYNQGSNKAVVMNDPVPVPAGTLVLTLPPPPAAEAVQLAGATQALPPSAALGQSFQDDLVLVARALVQAGVALLRLQSATTAAGPPAPTAALIPVPPWIANTSARTADYAASGEEEADELGVLPEIGSAAGPPAHDASDHSPEESHARTPAEIDAAFSGY